MEQQKANNKVNTSQALTRAGPGSLSVHLTPIGGEPPTKVRYRGNTPKDRLPIEA